MYSKSTPNTFTIIRDHVYGTQNKIILYKIGYDSNLNSKV